MSDSFLNAQLQMEVTIFEDVFAKAPKRISAPWGKIVERLMNPQTYPSKAACPLLKLASFGDTPNPSGSYRYDANMEKVFGIEVDYDGESISPEVAAQKLRDLSIEAVIYTSASHTPEKPRWRAIAPLALAIAPKERSHYVEILNGIFDGCLARESFTLSQSYFFGKVGDHYRAIHVSGNTLDASRNDLSRFIQTTNPALVAPKENDLKVPAAEQVHRALEEIYANEGYYLQSRSLTALLCVKGLDPAIAKALIKSIMRNHPRPAPDIDQYIQKIDQFLTSPDFLKQVQEFALDDYDPGIVEPGSHIMATEFILDSLICAGVVVLAAAPNAGKSTALVAIAMRAAGLIKDEFEPAIKRKVIIFTEHATQIEEIIMAMIGSGCVQSDYKTVRSMITIASAKRMTVNVISQCANYIDKHDYTYINTRGEKSFAARPWVIFDTTNANLDLENENDSQAVGKMMAQIKTEFFIKRSIPTLLSGHTAKVLKHGGANNLSARGSGAIEGDAHQVLYVTTDDHTGARYLEVSAPKHRFHTKVDSIKLNGGICDITAIDVFGDEIVYPVTFIERLEALSNEQKRADNENNKERARVEKAKNRENTLRSQIIDCLKFWPTLTQSMADAEIPTRAKILSKVGGRAADYREVFDMLVSEGHILCHDISSEQREYYQSMLAEKMSRSIKNYYWLRLLDDDFFTQRTQ